MSIPGLNVRQYEKLSLRVKNFPKISGFPTTTNNPLFNNPSHGKIDAEDMQSATVSM